MIECNECEAPTVPRQNGRFRQAICTECNREIRPNGTPVPDNSKQVERIRQMVYSLISEQYSDLAKENK